MSYVQMLTQVHTAISLVALVLAIPMLLRFIGGRMAGGVTDGFLVLALLTTITGFLFPFAGVTPAFATGLIASAIFVAVLVARYAFHYAGHWRWIYAAGMVLSAYLIAFVGVVQAFLKIPAVNALAPTQTEPAFLIAQGVTLLVFAVLTALAGLRFKSPLTLTPAQ